MEKLRRLFVTRLFPFNRKSSLLPRVVINPGKRRSRQNDLNVSVMLNRIFVSKIPCFHADGLQRLTTRGLGSLMDGPDGVLAQRASLTWQTAQSLAPGAKSCDYKAPAEPRSQIRSSSVFQSRGFWRIVAFITIMDLFFFLHKSWAVWVDVKSSDDGVSKNMTKHQTLI